MVHWLLFSDVQERSISRLRYRSRELYMITRCAADCALVPGLGPFLFFLVFCAVFISILGMPIRESQSASCVTCAMHYNIYFICSNAYGILGFWMRSFVIDKRNNFFNIRLKLPWRRVIIASDVMDMSASKLDGCTAIVTASSRHHISATITRTSIVISPREGAYSGGVLRLGHEYSHTRQVRLEPSMFTQCPDENQMGLQIYLRVGIRPGHMRTDKAKATRVEIPNMGQT
jgi:hypothetical protein